MDATYFSKFRIVQKDNHSVPPEIRALEDEIYFYFGKQISFPLIRKMIGLKGPKFVREVFEQIKKGEGIRDRKTLFLHKILTQQIKVEQN